MHPLSDAPVMCTKKTCLWVEAAATTTGTNFIIGRTLLHTSAPLTGNTLTFWCVGRKMGGSDTTADRTGSLAKPVPKQIPQTQMSQDT